jgi:membrane associated rhomboid family serine protease
VVGIDLGFLLLMPQLHWYVGLSGVLHGLLTAGAVAWWRGEDRRLTIALWTILLGKLAWEQWHGALPLSGDLTVIVSAHLYGAVSGLIAGLMLAKRIPSAAHRI